MIFNKDEFFSGDIKDLKDDLLHTSTEELAQLLESIALPEPGRLQNADALPETTAKDDAEFTVLIGLDIAQDQDSEHQDSED